MAAYSFNANSSFGTGFGKLYDPIISGFNGVLRGGSLSQSQTQSLVLDSEKGELVKAPAKAGKKELSEAKAMAALKSHSEAERRRRERINAHLDALRGLVPCHGKVDKATLLAGVINQVKELKKNAIEASKGYLIPMDDDEVKVEPHKEAAGDGSFLFKASICCDYRPELLSDLKQALDALPLKIVNVEMSTLGGRLKNVFLFTSCKEGNTNNAEASHLLANAVHQALSSVLDKASPSPEYSPRTTLPNKRQRISFFDSSSSSS
ncbi:transcription factor bHLH106-like [Pistacia vera]|uniref:transcription factor bHLH106-like n=1 Tax=Pistacia vera TaxID=55513 RepID=UPI001263B4F5|nr:transcription factor bHLH106-like [Pistacia vera]XP_031268275.1 transcription factor bHLH106-like [Pistacia vera]